MALLLAFAVSREIIDRFVYVSQKLTFCSVVVFNTFGALSCTIITDRQCKQIEAKPANWVKPSDIFNLKKENKKFFMVHVLGKIQVTLPGKAQQPLEQRYPFISMCAVFWVSKQWYGCQCLGFLTYAHNLIDAIANGNWMDTVRESALEVDSGRKIPCRTLGLEPTSILHLAFQPGMLLTELALPHYYDLQ